MDNKQFEEIYPVFKALEELSNTPNFSYTIDHHFRKNEYVCEIDLKYEWCNTKYRDVAILWWANPENVCDENNIKETEEEIRSFIKKAEKLKN